MKHGQSYLHVAWTAALCCFFSLTANAIILVPQLGATARVDFDSPNINSIVSTPCIQASSLNSTVTCSGSTSVPGTTATLNYVTTASANYGHLKAAGQSTILNSAPSGTGPYASQSYGEAHWADNWTFTGGVGFARLKLIYDLSGTYNISAVNSGAILDFFLVNLDTHEGSSPLLPILSTDPGTQILAEQLSLYTNFVFGVPFDFYVGLMAGSSLFELGDGGEDGLSAFLDLSTTATLVAINVEDANGDIVPFNLITASGESLFSQLATGTVAEPPTSSLISVAFAVLFIAASKRRHCPSSRQLLGACSTT